jgi:hypothetical protein
LLGDGRDGRPRLQIFESCVNLIRAIPQAQRSRTDPEDIMDYPLDHCLDSLRYALQHREASFRAVRVTGT